MGVFKSMRDLTRQARQIERSMPPARDRMAAAQARMARVNRMLAAQTQAANATVAGTAGAPAVRRTVAITGMRQIGMLNFDLLVEFDLAVLPDGLRPYPATTQQRVSQVQIGRLRPGLFLEASADPSNPAAVWLDLESLR